MKRETKAAKARRDRRDSFLLCFAVLTFGAVVGWVSWDIGRRAVRRDLDVCWGIVEEAAVRQCTGVCLHGGTSL